MKNRLLPSKSVSNTVISGMNKLCIILLLIATGYSSFGQTISATCSGANNISVNSVTPVFKVEGNPGSPSVSGCTSQSVIKEGWFKFSATTTFSVVTFSNIDNVTAYVYIYSGICGSETYITCMSITSNNIKLVNFPTAAGQQYFIRILSVDAGTISGSLGVFSNRGTQAALCTPDKIPYSTGTVIKNGTKTDDTITSGGKNSTYFVGYAKFNTSDIPVETSTLNGIALGITCRLNGLQSTFFGDNRVYFVKMKNDAIDPVTAAGTLIYLQSNFPLNALYDKNFGPADFISGKTNVYQLNNFAITNFITKYTQGWWGMTIPIDWASGYMGDDERIFFYGWNSQYPPFLVVTYTGGSLVKSIICGESAKLTCHNTCADTTNTTYQWSPPTGLSATNIKHPIAKPGITTTYKVTMTSNGCISVDSAKIIVNPLTINAGADVSISCGNQAQLSCTSNRQDISKLKYQWSPSAGLSATDISNPVANPNHTTSYIVMASDSFCSAFDIVNIKVRAVSFGINFNASAQMLSNPPFIVQFNNLTPYLSNFNFTWYFGDGNSLQSNNSTVSHEFLHNGIYDITLIAANKITGCTDSSYKAEYIYCIGGSNCTHVATINQSSPITGCVGNPVMLSCNNIAGATYQWNYNGVAIDNTNSLFYYADITGNYSVTIIVNGCPVTSKIVSVVFKTVPPVPTITSKGSLAYCGGGSDTLTVNKTGYDYLWSTGENTQSIIVTKPGFYSVIITDNNGCFSQSEPFAVSPSPLVNPEICIVTVDDISGKNKIIWNKPSSKAIAKFNIYGQGSQTNVFDLLGSVPYSSLSVFTDNTSNPAQQSYLYKISAIDTCNAETALSDYHKSIHLTINAGINNTWNLIWNYYEGFSFPSYNIYRGTSQADLALLTTIASNLNSFTDLNPPAGNVFYQIEAVNPNPCTPTKSANNSSRSNVALAFKTKVNEADNISKYVVISPNPAISQITIEYPFYSSVNNPVVELYNIEGSLIKTLQLSGRDTKVNISKIPAGLYLIKISDKNSVAYQKFIKI